MTMRYFLILVFAGAVTCGCAEGATPPIDPDPPADAGSCLEETDACTDDVDCCSLSCQVDQCAPAFVGAPLGASCGAGENCNSENCNAESGVCVGPAGECSSAEVACTFGWECCSGACGGGICTDPPGSCHALGVACITDGNCCAGRCQAMVCVLQITISGGTGDPCAHDVECTSGTCLSGKCVAPSCDAAPTSCTPGVDDGDCCSGACSEVSGECTEVPLCAETGGLCGAHWECCDSLCNPYSGRCEPPDSPPT